MTGSGQGDTGRRTPEALKSLPPGLLPTGRGSGLEEGATCPGSRSGCSEGSALWWLQTRMNTRAIDEPKPKAERVKPEVLAQLQTADDRLVANQPGRARAMVASAASRRAHPGDPPAHVSTHESAPSRSARRKAPPARDPRRYANGGVG